MRLADSPRPLCNFHWLFKRLLFDKYTLLRVLSHNFSRSSPSILPDINQLTYSTRTCVSFYIISL